MQLQPRRPAFMASSFPPSTDAAPRAPARGTLGRIGSRIVRLAVSEAEIAAAQRLRHRIFVEEDGGVAADQARDRDRFDAYCDHLIVIDAEQPRPEAERIVATCRMLRQSRADAAGGFYSQAEFDIAGLAARHRDLVVLELGRSCVLPTYRSRRTVDLLWQGIWAYARRNGIGIMAGCASFPGTVPAAHAEALSFLHHHCRADADWRVEAAPGRHHSMDLMPCEAVRPRAALASMPPLVKGYLRLGAMIGEGCVVDHAFGTTDVFIILPVARISERYVNFYGIDADRFAG